MFPKRLSISHVSHGSSLAARAVIAGAALAVAAGTGLFAAATARANTTIYQDSFNRTGGLNGSAPTIDTGGLGGTAGATWSAMNGSVADAGWATSTTGGGQLNYSSYPAGTTSSYNATAWLPFTPQSGQVYTAQTTFVARTTGTAADWLGFFFDASPNVWQPGVNPPWMFVRPSLSAHSDAGYATAGTYVGGPTAGGTSSSGTYTSDTIVTSMILNTTTPGNWTVQFKWNDLTNPGDSVTTAVTSLGATPAVQNDIGFVTVPPATGTITNFSLTAVPEPATLGLFAAAGATLLLLKRRAGGFGAARGVK